MKCDIGYSRLDSMLDTHLVFLPDAGSSARKSMSPLAKYLSTRIHFLDIHLIDFPSESTDIDVCMETLRHHMTKSISLSDKMIIIAKGLACPLAEKLIQWGFCNIIAIFEICSPDNRIHAKTHKYRESGNIMRQRLPLKTSASTDRLMYEWGRPYTSSVDSERLSRITYHIPCSEPYQKTKNRNTQTSSRKIPCKDSLHSYSLLVKTRYSILNDIRLWFRLEEYIERLTTRIEIPNIKSSL